jgi:hypothetical protein
MPDVPDLIALVNAGNPTPFGATTPKPVITTLFLNTDFTNFGNLNNL